MAKKNLGRNLLCLCVCWAQWIAVLWSTAQEIVSTWKVECVGWLKCTSHNIQNTRGSYRILLAILEMVVLSAKLHSESVIAIKLKTNVRFSSVDCKITKTLYFCFYTWMLMDILYIILQVQMLIIFQGWGKHGQCCPQLGFIINKFQHAIL